MTTVPDDPVSTPPEGEPNLDPGAPTPAEPGADPDPGTEPFTHSLAARRSQGSDTTVSSSAAGGVCARRQYDLPARRLT